MVSTGMYGLLSSITTSNSMAHDRLRSNSLISNSRAAFRYYFYGLHEKTKRTLAEEAECGDEISVASWIKDGSDPNELDAYGYTPLLNAAALGRLNAVEQLIKNKADVNRKGPFGFTPLHAAAQNGHRDVVKLLIENGADINSQNDDNDTPLHLALTTREISIVHILVRQRCNVFLKGFLDKDCVQTAKECGLSDLAEYMRKYGLCIHSQSAPGMLSH